jgi:hypothetical protein
MSEQGSPGQHWGAGDGQGYDGPPAYGVPAYGAGYGAPGYGPPAYGPPPGHQPAYPPAYPPHHGAPWPGAAPLPWPHGSARPGLATAAAVLGFVTGGLTLLGSLGFLIAAANGDGDAATVVLVLGLPCAAGMIYGGVRLLGRRSPVPLFASALAAVGVLLIALLVAAGTLRGDAMAGIAFFAVLAGVLPVLTAVFARLPVTLGWVGSGPPA